MVARNSIVLPDTRQRIAAHPASVNRQSLLKPGAGGPSEKEASYFRWWNVCVGVNIGSGLQLDPYCGELDPAEFLVQPTAGLGQFRRYGRQAVRASSQVPLANFPFADFYGLLSRLNCAGKMSPRLHLSRSMICCNRPKVTLCWPFSNRNRVEGVMPSFFANRA